MITEAKTTIEIQVSFIVSAPEATKTSDFMSLPVSLRYFARRNFVAIEAIKTMIVPAEKLSSSGVMIFLIELTINSIPNKIIIRAIIIVVIRSILMR